MIGAGGNGWRFWLVIGALVALHFLLRITFGLAGPAVPDLLTLAVLLGARRTAGAGAVALGFLLGLLQDAASISSFGANAMAYTIVGYFGSRSRELFLGESFLFFGVYVFLGKWGYDALHFMLSPATRRLDAFSALLVQSPLAALYLAAVGIAVIVVFGAPGRRR